jgi:hypothetical protein
MKSLKLLLLSFALLVILNREDKKIMNSLEEQEEKKD